MTETRDIFRRILDLDARGEAAVLVTLIDAGGSTPRHDVARMLVFPDGSVEGTIGGGKLEYEMTQRAVASLEAGSPSLESFNLKDIGMTCGGRVQVLIEPLLVPPRLVLFGAGHVAAEVAPVAARCGFVVQVIDDRDEFASRERFPDASSFVHSFEPADWEPLGLGPDSSCVVVTRGHEHDYRVVRALIERDLGYLGMMGSRKKVRETRARLSEEGLDESALERLHAPIGLDIGSETPAEIAISIVAEVIQARRGTTR